MKQVSGWDNWPEDYGIDLEGDELTDEDIVSWGEEEALGNAALEREERRQEHDH